MKYTADEFIKPNTTILPQSLSAALTNGSGVDTQGFKEALVVFHAGTAAASAEADVHVEESSDDSTYVNITGAVFTQVTTANDNTIYVGRIKLEKRLRYLRAVNVGDGTNAVVLGVSIILLAANVLPVTQVNASVFDV
jgi:hypothetical protein